MSFICIPAQALKALASPPRIFEWEPWVGAIFFGSCLHLIHNNPMLTWLLLGVFF